MYLSFQEKISALFLINFESRSKIQGNIYSQQAMRRQSQRIQRSRSVILKLRITTLFQILILKKLTAHCQSETVKIVYVLSQELHSLCIPMQLMPLLVTRVSM